MITPTFPDGQTLVIVRPGPKVKGGDPGTPEADRAVPGCVVWPGDTTELTGRQDTVTADLTTMWPFDTDIVSTDQVRDPDDPTKLCDVVGSPLRYRNPRTGTQILTVRLQRVSG